MTNFKEKRNNEVLKFIKENLGREYYDKIDAPKVIYRIIGATISNGIRVLVAHNESWYSSQLPNDIILSNFPCNTSMKDLPMEEFIEGGWLSRYE